jgi:hypothetical protein
MASPYVEHGLPVSMVGARITVIDRARLKQRACQCYDLLASDSRSGPCAAIGRVPGESKISEGIVLAGFCVTFLPGSHSESRLTQT